jgi:acetate kinase
MAAPVVLVLNSGSSSVKFALIAADTGERVWGGLAERERRVLRAPRQRASRRDRDRAIAAADAAGYTRVEIARTFGLSRTSVSRILLRAADVAGRR